MPKDRRIRAAALAARETRHQPLGQVIHEDEIRGRFVPELARSREMRSRRKDDEEDGGEQFLDERESRRILELSKEQQLEIETEKIQTTLSKSSNLESDNDDDDGVVDNESQESYEEEYVEHDNGFVTLMENSEALSPEEEAVVAAMNGNTGTERVTLADLIMEKIREKEGGMEDEPESDEMSLPSKIVEVYTEIGKILSRFTSGKLPKAFKVIPSLSNWEDVLYLTRPDLWTPQAMFAATRIFASNLNPKMAQRFYNLVLLDSVRADIMANKKLNYHYYMSLKKAVYKPAAFFKGILLPLCQDHCTLREAAIVASVLQRVSIPSQHSAVAIHKLAQLEYSGAASIFIKTLLNKKYSLPSQVTRKLVEHFVQFKKEERTLPVLWHQSLLVFVQRYKNDLNEAARKSLRAVMKHHFHPKLTPEIRRELFGRSAWETERSSLS